MDIKKAHPVYLSIVATTRNDGNDPKDIQRLNLFVNNIRWQAEKYNIDCEIIIVEWNPNPTQPNVATIIDQQNPNRHCQVRIITVPTEIHNKRHNSDRLALFQMIAKNVGIRRAKGKFVLATNIDILFSDALMLFLSKSRLASNKLYRVERFDVPKSLPIDLDYEHLMDYCQQNIIRQYKRLSISKPNNQIEKNVHWKLKPLPLVLDLFREVYCRKKISLPLRLHTNASGDFTLMSRDGWQKTRGYPELDVLAMHMDSLLCYNAHYTGFKERIIYDPVRIFHIDHESRADGLGRYYAREEILDPVDDIGTFKEKIRTHESIRVTSPQLYHWALIMRRKKAPLTFNDQNWGHALEDFAETTLI